MLGRFVLFSDYFQVDDTNYSRIRLKELASKQNQSLFFK